MKSKPMEDRLQTPGQIQLSAMPEGLVDGVLERIRIEEEYLKFRKAALFVLCGLCVSLLGLIWSLGHLIDGMARSGFSSIASLAYSDTSVVMQHWQDFAYSLLESLPVISMIIVLTSLVAALHFLSRTWKETKTAVRILRFTHH
jgi:hypothetical protein